MSKNKYRYSYYSEECARKWFTTSSSTNMRSIAKAISIKASRDMKRFIFVDSKKIKKGELVCH